MYKQNMQVIHFPCSNFCLQDATLWSKTQLDPFSFNIHLLYEHWSYVEQEGLLSTCSDLVGKAWNLFGWQVQPHGCKNCLERVQDAFNVHPGLGTKKMSPWFHLKKKCFFEGLQHPPWLKDAEIKSMGKHRRWENLRNTQWHFQPQWQGSTSSIWHGSEIADAWPLASWTLEVENHNFLGASEAYIWKAHLIMRQNFINYWIEWFLQDIQLVLWCLL